MRRSPLLVLFFFSGVAGLIYELVWVRQLTLVFGGTTYAITTVVVAFMAGLGLGSYLAGRMSRRIERTVRTYGLLEISIGCYALIIPALLGLAEPAYRAIYPLAAADPWLLTAFRFLVSVVILIVPTTCMGATLPILVRHIALTERGLGRSVGYAYGINTLGAVLGVLLAGFFLIPGLGLENTTRLAAAVNIAIGLTAVLYLARRAAPGHAADAVVEDVPAFVPDTPPLSPATRRIVLLGFAASGFAAMVYQITWTRALVLSLGSSTYSFTCILAAFILGLALGSLAVTRIVDRWKSLVSGFGVLELGIAIAAMLIVPLNRQIPFAVVSIVQKNQEHFGALLSLQFLLIIAVTIIPTLLMGAIFPLVIRMLAHGTGDAGAATGRAYAVNTIGTIAGSFLAGFVLIRSDVLGVQNSIIFASALNGVIGFALVLIGRRGNAAPFARAALVPAGVVLVAIPLLALAFGRWDTRLMSSAPFMGRTISKEAIDHAVTDYFADGVDMTVSVYHRQADPDYLTLTVNGKPDASTGLEDMTTQLLLGHLPAILGPKGGKACVIGLGSGMTLAAVACHPGYERLDCVEIGDEVIRAASYFQPYAHDVLSKDPRVRVIRADGRNHLLLTDARYDLIVCEPSNPWISGVANLFTREFFSLCRSRLSDDGVLAIWLQGYSTSVEDFRMVLRTLFTLSDDVSLWTLYFSDYMLVMRKGAQPLSVEEFVARCEEPAVRNDLYRVGLHRPSHLLGRYIASGAELRAWVGDGPLNTDDNARLEFSAPRNLYAGQFHLVEALYPLQRPVLPTLFPNSDAATSFPRLDDEIATVVAARWAPMRVNQLLGEGKAEIGLRFMLDAYRADPTNPVLFGMLTPLRDQLMKSGNASSDSSEAGGILDRLRRIEPPVTTPRRNAGSADVVASLRKWAAQSEQWGFWDAAESHLFEALSLEPGNREVANELIALFEQTGRGARADSLREVMAPR
jgi:spermidine synthase